ncbi:Imm51 family immunity protein [Deinococcus sp.]|uniref:Imm51 family immunity protein n=1 Tax=Deinococcus sp. TaxID=47478 RepID=UPI003CC6D242
MSRDAPAKLIEQHSNDHTLSYSLIFDDFGPTAAIFEEHGYEAGGYAWHGVVDALVRLHAPEIAQKINYDPESSMFSAYGDDPAALLRVDELMRQAQAEPQMLNAALEHADPELMD